jgi:hypothetical protein
MNHVKIELNISSNCPHCKAMMEILSGMLKTGKISSLTINNIELLPELVKKYSIRSVPWIKINDFIFDQALEKTDIQFWIESCISNTGVITYIKDRLKTGKLYLLIPLINEHPEWMTQVIILLETEDTDIHIKLGIGALMEEFAGTDILEKHVEELGRLSMNSDHRLRIDAMHYLGLLKSNQAREFILKGLEDNHPDVREEAQDALELLK